MLDCFIDKWLEPLCITVMLLLVALGIYGATVAPRDKLVLRISEWECSKISSMECVEYKRAGGNGANSISQD